MVRTQIQLTNEESRRAKRLAARNRVSVSELIRRSLDRTLREEVIPPDDEEIRRRAIAAIGAFRSDKTDVARRHDDYLAEAYRE
jgi:antitoxin component of RelBE/YafQ-DinJ toxin-antitoxin module